MTLPTNAVASTTRSIWETAARAILESARAQKVRIWAFASAAVAICGTGIVGAVAMDKRPSYLFSEVGAFGRFSGTFTMASAMCMFSCGVLLLLIARSRAPFSRSERLAWVVAAVGLMTLAFDELMQLHEWIGGGLSWLGVPFPFGLAADNYVFLGYASAALWVMLRLLPKFATVSQALPWAVIMLVCYAFSQMVDLVPLERLAERTILILAPIEEAPKVIGSFAALLFGIFAHEQITQGPRA